MNNDPWRAVSLGLCLLSVEGAHAGAGELPRADEAMDYLAPALVAHAHPRWTVEHRRESAIVGDVLLWPSVTLGGLVDSNPFQAHRPGVAALGFHIAPKLLAEHESGLHRTDFYAAGDIRIYPGERGADASDARAGVLHDWAIQRDANLRLQGEIARRTDPFNNTQLVAVSAQRGLLQQTDVVASASVQKTFSRTFVVLSGSALRSHFDDVNNAATGAHPTLSDETVLVLKGRAGYWFGPPVFAFTESGVDERRLDALAQTTTGTRTVVGLGAANVGLLGGEVFAGWQAHSYRAPWHDVSTPVAGGRLSWTPSPGWTVSGQADRSLGDVAAGTSADPVGTPVRQDTGLVDIRCVLTPLWRAEAVFGAVRLDYVGTRRRDRLAFAGLQVDYALSRSLDLTTAVRFTALKSTFAAAAYQRTTATLGATYHY